jgi:predicted phosphodiesterase
MRVAVLCDIHGNLPALQAVLADVEKIGVDVVVFGGDVAASPMPVETIEVLSGYIGRARFVAGMRTVTWSRSSTACETVPKRWTRGPQP